MEVKIYREKENEELILNEDFVTEYNELALALGIFPIDKAKQNQIPGVYPPLNYAMQKSLQALCPKIESIEKFNYCTIPLEVLKVIQLAKTNQMYDGFQVWYNDVEPDPLLIGWNWKSESDKTNDYKWLRNRYLIARWGDCSLEISELLAKGNENLKIQLIDKATIIIEKAKAVLQNPDLYVNTILNQSSEIPRADFLTSADKQIY